MTLTPAEFAACNRLIDLALAEDLDAAGDVTSQSTIVPELQGRAAFVARSSGVVTGLEIIPLVADAAKAALRVEMLVADSSRVEAGVRLATLAGPVRGLLVVERIALNFIQRLSGIATLTRRYVDAVADLPCKILDTRKTTPGWRLLEKYAVRCGGGHNHRFCLYDGILIKDNHLAALGGGPDAIRLAIDKARQHAPNLSLEVEVENLDQLAMALSCRPDIILLDDVSLDIMREAVRRRNDKAPDVLLEASGGVTLATVRAIAETGVDRISVGALTHSAPALDIALDYLSSHG